MLKKKKTPRKKEPGKKNESQNVIGSPEKPVSDRLILVTLGEYLTSHRITAEKVKIELYGEPHESLTSGASVLFEGFDKRYFGKSDYEVFGKARVDEAREIRKGKVVYYSVSFSPGKDYAMMQAEGRSPRKRTISLLEQAANSSPKKSTPVAPRGVRSRWYAPKS